MEQRVSAHVRQGGREHADRLPGGDGGARLKSLIGYISRGWNQLPELIVSPLGPTAFVVPTKRFVGKEKPVLSALSEHEAVILFSVDGRERGRDRGVGYLLIFTGTPSVYHYTRCCALSYSEPTDIRYRQPKVLYNDPSVRLMRFGAGSFGYLLSIRPHTPEQYSVPAPNHVTHLRYAGSWKDGS